MTDQLYIKKCQDITDRVMFEVFKTFKSNSKLILTESDLKCWMFHHFQSNINENIHIHSEITHYLKTNDPDKNYFFRDMTILDPDNLSLNETLWNKGNNERSLSKGFKHNGPAVHFELKLIRQKLSPESKSRIDSTDIGKLNKVDSTRRAFNFIWGSKGAELNDLKEELIKSLDDFVNKNFDNNGYMKFYLFDSESIEVSTWKGKGNDLEWKSLNEKYVDLFNQN